MEKKYKYSTLPCLFRALSNKNRGRAIFTLSDLLSGRACLNGQLAPFTLSDELREKVLQLFAGVIWKEATPERVQRVGWMQDCGILRRVWIVKERGEYIGDYCAGQDYDAEMRYIRRLAR